MMKNQRKLSALVAVALVALSPASLYAQQQRRQPARQQSAAPATGREAATKTTTTTTRGGIPAHPNDLKFNQLDYTPPKRDKYRRVLSNGAIAYLVEDHDFPLVNVSVLVRTGGYLVPSGKEGLASLTGSQIRQGGTTSKKAQEFDEAADFLAANISSGIGDTQGNANLNCLSKDVDQGLALYFDMLKNPGFQADRLALAKSQILQQMERRNDETASIEGREWARLMRGTDHFSTKQSTKASIEAITRDDMLAFHKQYYQPAAFIFAVSGDFKTDEMVAKLESQMKDWASNKAAVPDVPKPTFAPVAGVYTVNKSDVNQGRVIVGHTGTTRDNPDSYALSIMDDILGGGGFTSRIMSRVRSDEGLAYSAGSNFGLGVYYPGDFRAAFQSKSATTAQAIDIVMEEINRIRTTKVTPEELTTAKNSAIETFPLVFATAAQIAGTFALDEYTKRPADYWDEYRNRIKAVTADDIQRVGQKYLQPDKLVVLVVGNIDDITKGNPDRPQHSLAKIAKDGQIRRIPLPDPLTLVYPATQ
ncbi:MAG TPA: pitrilysin family protein [Pyrinomonadaceae bacterium]|jgi:predicted Zn-dependent peptidase|nr:pitrilysin family protein [Pyrinomonadaceae bacterium]